MSTARLRLETSENDVLWRTWTRDDEFPFHFLKLVKALKNSFQGETAYIPQIERVQIDAIKFERTQIHFLATFSLPLSSSLLKGDVTQYDSKGRFLAFVLC